MQCINFFFFSFLVDGGTTQSLPDVTSQSDDPLSVSSQSESGKKLILARLISRHWYGT